MRLWLRARLWWLEREVSRLLGIERGMWHYRHGHGAQGVAIRRLILECEMRQIEARLNMSSKPRSWRLWRPRNRKIKLPRMRAVKGAK